MEKFSYIPKYTYSDYQNWEGKWELIDGNAYAMTPLPSIKHQDLSGNIHFQLKKLLEKCRKCKPLLPFDWKISNDTIIQPDNSVICYPVGDENYLTKPPSLIFEILSPSTATKDRIIKYHIYQEQGVKYYVIVDPKTSSTDVFELKNNEYEKIVTTTNDKIIFDLNECNITFDFSEIWV